MSIRSFRNVSASLLLVTLLGGCNSTGDNLRLTTSGGVAKTCVSNLVEGATDMDNVNFLIQACLGDAVSPLAKITRSHIATLILANYGERSIRKFQNIDPEHASADALLLQHRIEKAVDKLSKSFVAEKTGRSEKVLRGIFPTYRELSNAPTAEVQLYGVVRAALAPAARRTKSAIKSYITASTGGAAGILREVISRRRTIKAKYIEIRKTLKLGEAATIDTACLLSYIDSKSNVGVEYDAGSCPDSYPRNIMEDKFLWNAVNSWLDHTRKKLTELADSA